MNWSASTIPGLDRSATDDFEQIEGFYHRQPLHQDAGLSQT